MVWMQELKTERRQEFKSGLNRSFWKRIITMRLTYTMRTGKAARKFISVLREDIKFKNNTNGLIRLKMIGFSIGKLRKRKAQD